MTRRLSLLPLLALTLTLLPELSPSQEWPRFRGENGVGVGNISGLPNQFTRAAYDWAVGLDGVGHSSPVLWGDRLFLTLASEQGDERRVSCFDSESGETLWTVAYPAEKHNLHRDNNFASATPAVSADAVFVVWASGNHTEALALDHEGGELWKRSWPEFSSDHGFGASPIVCEGLLILHTDSSATQRSRVIALDPNNGETVWTLERIMPPEDNRYFTGYGTPAALTVDGTTMLAVVQTNDGWKGLDPKTGAVLWEHHGDYSQRNVASVVAGEGIVFTTFGSGGKGKQATALAPVADGDPEVLYDLGISDGLGYVPTPLIHDGLLYLWSDGGILTCRDARTGERFYRERVGGNFYSSPIVADGKIYCGSRNGEFIAVKLGPEFEVLGRSRLGSGMNATPAVANGRLFLRTDTHLISLRGQSR